MVEESPEINLGGIDSSTVLRDRNRNKNEETLKLQPSCILQDGYKTKISVALSVIVIFTGSLLLIIFCGIKKQTVRNCRILSERDVTLADAKPSDLECLSSEVKSLNIISVESLSPNTEINVSSDILLSIHNLTLSCPISEKWLHFLIKNFPNIDILKFDEDQLCKNSNLGLNPKEFPEKSFKKLRTLNIENMNQKCYLSGLIFSKWNTPVLENLIIKNSKIDCPFCEKLMLFLNKVRNSIDKIQITGSAISNNFNIFDIQFKKLRILSIKSENFYSTDWDEQF